MQVTGQIMPTSEVGKKLGLTEAIGFTADYEFGETLEDSRRIFGDEAVHNSFLDKAIVAFQSKLRSIAARIQAGVLTAEAGHAEAASWKLGVIQRPSGGNLVEKAKASIKKMTAEQKAELLRQLQEMDE